MSHDDDPELWHAINRLSSLIDTMHEKGLFTAKNVRGEDVVQTGMFEFLTGTSGPQQPKIPTKQSMYVSDIKYDNQDATAAKSNLTPLTLFTDPQIKSPITIAEYRKIITSLPALKQECEANIAKIQDHFLTEQYKKEMEAYKPLHEQYLKEKQAYEESKKP